MICTSSYNDWKSDKYRTISISGNRGKDANYKGEYCKDLAPKLSFWKTWHDNIGKVPEEENNRYYVQEYWNQVLSKLNPEKVYSDLYFYTLLCYEPNTEFCHRHIVAAWLEILLGIEVPEMKAKDYQVEKTTRPEYIKEYLEDAMKLNRNMRGFTSLRALYLFEKGEQLEARADELEEQTGKCYDSYRQEAYFYRCDADDVEVKYRESQRQKKLSKTKPKD